MSFCDFLFKQGYYERCLVNAFKALYKFPDDEIVSVLNYYKLMQPLTTTEYNEVCKSYENFGSKLFDEMFIGYWTYHSANPAN